MPDLFGHPTEQDRRDGERERIASLPPALRGEAWRLYEAMQRAERRFLRNPSPANRRGYCSAERAYLALRDHKTGMSGAEVRASLVADGLAAPLPPDNRDIFE